MVKEAEPKIRQEEQEKIITTLNERIKELTCPMCQNKKFVLANGYYYNILQSDLEQVSLDGQMTPVIGIICTKCGFLSQHALGALGLLSSEGEKQ